MIQNQQDENEVFNVFLQDYNNNFRSKISELFYAIQKTGTTCKLCNRTQYNFQAYFFLVFPLEEVKKYIINKINTPQNMNNINNPLINNNNMMMNNFQGMNMNMINNGFNFMNNMNNFNMNNINPMMLQFMYNFMLMMNPNINVNNPMNVNNNLMNFINANPFFFQYFMNSQNNNNNTNNLNQTGFKPVQNDLNKGKNGILPRPNPNDNKPKSFFICPNNMGDRSNIMFVTGAGVKTMVVAPLNLPIKDLFKEYITKMGQDPRVLGKYIYFLFNGLKMDINEPKSIIQYGLNSSSVIMVVDTSNLLGGSL
jgi:hypothetical protein